MKSPKEVAEEVSALKEMKPKVRKFSIFYDNHHAAIEAQIEVLEDKLDESEIFSKLDSGEWTEHQRESASEALAWLNEEADEAPSIGWKDLVQK